MASHWFALLALCLGRLCAAGHSPTRYLIVSAPRDGKVSYGKVKHGSQGPIAGTMQTLIETGLTHPQGIVVDQKRRRLLVTDPDAKKIFAYALYANGDKLSVGPQTVAAEGTEARWVAVDGTGTMFFSDEPKNQIMKIDTVKADKGDTTPEAVYNGAEVALVSAPGGLAVDNFHTYWVNKRIGRDVGSLVKGSQHPDTKDVASFTQVLSRNSDKSYGVCMALGNVYYTQPDTAMYGVKKSGGEPVLMTDKLTNPRGCAFDGDGTVYVADRGANAVYAFAGGSTMSLMQTKITKAADMKDAFGVAVYSGAMGRLGSFSGLLVAVAALAAALQ